MKSFLTRSAALAAVVLAVSALPPPTGAQSPADTAKVPRAATMLPGGAMQELLLVYVPRPEAEIRRLLDDARNRERSSASEVNEARRLASQADDRQKIMDAEMATTKARRDFAKKTKDDAARNNLEATLKRQSSERQYLERLRDALRADASLLEAERDASAKRVKALELELRVAAAYAEIESGASQPAKVSEYRSLLRELLEAQKQAADQWKDASEKRKLVADRRLKQLESLSKLYRR